MGAVSAIELDAPAAPVASILIVTTLAGSLVRGCLERLAEIAPETPFETIVVLNGADPGEAQRLRVETSGVHIVESDVNLGSAGGLNLARPFARGEYLVSLHDDARPARGWLDALVRAAESEPDAGAVGSLVLNRDGSVQAAGWHLLPGGSTRPPWSGDPPPPSAFTTRRAVDYAPMCSILIRARAWDDVGGIDERYAPAYYTDVDLALALRARGMRVLCEPASVVEHWRGTSSTARFAVFVSGRNRQKLLEKWGDVVRSHEPGSGAATSVGEGPDASLGVGAVPAQDWQRDARAREQKQLARILGVSQAFATSLEHELTETTAARDAVHSQLAAVSEQLRTTARDLEQTRAELEQTRAEHAATRSELDRTAAELGAACHRLESVEARLPWLEWRAEVLANIEAGGWWRLRGRLLPALRAAASARRVAKRILLTRP